MVEISNREQFYQQEYCGCVYSLRDANRHRRENGRERIKIGLLYYGQDNDTASVAAHLPLCWTCHDRPAR